MGVDGNRMPKTKGKAVPRRNVRIPKPIVDEVDEIVRDFKLYVNRQQFVESAIREKIERVKFLRGREAASLGPELGITTGLREIGEDFLVGVKDTFLAHAIVNAVKGKDVPGNHLDVKQFERFIREYLKKRAMQEGKRITEEQLDELTADLLEYHRRILEGLSLTASH